MFFFKDDEESEEEDIELEAEEEELPGMSLKKTPSVQQNTKVISVIDPKERKQINKTALQELQKSKVFKAQGRLKAKKMSKDARFAKGRKMKKKRDRIHNPKKIV